MTEEEKAIKWLEKNTKNYNLSGEELHYSLILFYLIINLQQKNKKYKETIDKAINYIELHSKFIFHGAERRVFDGKLEYVDETKVFTGSPTELLDILKEVK